MRRYWLDQNNLQTDSVLIDGDPFHHIFGVCRQDKGSQFEVIVGDGKAYEVEVISLDKKRALARILKSRNLPVLPRPHIHLALSLPKYPTIEAVIEKAVELGVHSIHPFFSEFSFLRKSSSFPTEKLERWKKIVISATQQSGRAELMNISEPVPINKILQKFNQSSNKMGLFAYEGTADQKIDQYLQSMRAHIEQSPIGDIWLFVGSEGGFSTTEVQEFQQVGLHSVSLGEQVLRVETACITLISILKYEFRLF